MRKSKVKDNTEKTRGDEDQEICSFFEGGAGELVFWAFRYFVGRMTIATTCFARDLAKAWKYLPQREKDLIHKELDQLFEDDNRARKQDSKHLPLGMDMDRDSWQLVRDAYVQEALDKDICSYCKMPFYNCLCSHEN